MGINLWFAPQISEQWPQYKPVKLLKNEIEFNRPGLASILTPKEGILQLWSTSSEVIILNTFPKGKTKWLSVSNIRLEKIFFDSKYESKFNRLK